MTLHVLPLPEAFLQKVRTEGVDDLGQPVRPLTAQGGEPCRDVLRRARPGERIILASFCPCPVPGPYREFGPIFLLAEPSDEPVNRTDLPARRGGPEDYFGPQVGVRAHNVGGDIVDGDVVAAEASSHLAAQYLARPDVDHVQVRLHAYGCFACRVEAVPA